MMHEAYCCRNFIKCPKCSEMVDKNQKAEHEDEFHKMVQFLRKKNHSKFKILFSGCLYSLRKRVCRSGKNKPRGLV